MPVEPVYAANPSISCICDSTCGSGSVLSSGGLCLRAATRCSCCSHRRRRGRRCSRTRRQSPSASRRSAETPGRVWIGGVETSGVCVANPNNGSLSSTWLVHSSCLRRGTHDVTHDATSPPPRRLGDDATMGGPWPHDRCRQPSGLLPPPPVACSACFVENLGCRMYGEPSHTSTVALRDAPVSLPPPRNSAISANSSFVLS